MSLVTKISPVGIDKAIDRIQRNLFSYLTTTAGWTNYESYPRAYKNPKGNDTIPEVYVGNNDYQEVFFDDKFNVTSFFLVEDTVTNNNVVGDEPQYTQGISIIFQATLPELYPSISHRADAEMHDDIFKAFDSFFKEVNSVSTGINNVYSDVTVLDSIQFTDMSDFHVVKFDTTIDYLYNCKFDEL